MGIGGPERMRDRGEGGVESGVRWQVGWGGRGVLDRDAEWKDWDGVSRRNGEEGARRGAGRGDLAQRVGSSRREVVDFEEGFHDIGPLCVGVHACDVDGVEAPAVLGVYDASVLEGSLQTPEWEWIGNSKACAHRLYNMECGCYQPSQEHFSQP